MCYSARLNQKLREIAKRYGAEVAWENFEEIFRRRMEGERILVARGLELSFDVPASQFERATKQYIDEFNRRQAETWEKDIFSQRQRQGEAKEALKRKETKSARESLRISTCKIERLLERLAALKRNAPSDEDRRIFPQWYAPVIVNLDGRRQIVPMRYGCRLAGHQPSNDPYNARRDSLAGFWRMVYGRNHAVMVIDGFYENVPRHLYEQRELAPGEQEQNVILRFDRRPAEDMLIACIWDKWSRPNETLYSFAAVTDEPPQEIAATGHQRCVIPIDEGNLSAWLSPAGASKADLERLLSERPPCFYEHEEAA